MIKRILFGAMITIIVFALALPVAAGGKPEDPGGGDGEFVPVTLCHASPTGAGGSGPAKKYELITVDNQGAYNGHLGHPNDIIPATKCPTPPGDGDGGNGNGNGQRAEVSEPRTALTGVNFPPGQCATHAGTAYILEEGTGNLLAVAHLNVGDCWSGWIPVTLTWTCSRPYVYWREDGALNWFPLGIYNAWLCGDQSNMLEVFAP